MEHGGRRGAWLSPCRGQSRCGYCGGGRQFRVGGSECWMVMAGGGGVGPRVMVALGCAAGRLKECSRGAKIICEER